MAKNQKKPVDKREQLLIDARVALNVARIALDAAEHRLRTGEDYYIKGEISGKKVLMSNQSYDTNINSASFFIGRAMDILIDLRFNHRGPSLIKS
jgi:hypothetical protein